MNVPAPARHPAKAPGASWSWYGAVLPVAVWFVLLLNVQPWSQSESGSTAAVKGASLLAVALLTLLVLPARARFVLPWPLGIWLGYAMVLICAALLQEGTEPMLRAARVLLGVLIPAVIWVSYKGREGLLETSALICFAGLACVVIAGAVLQPGEAWLNGRAYSSGGRLMGAFLPMMPPRVGEIGAVLIGLAVVRWAFGGLRLRLLLPLVASGLGLVVLSRTRTALLAMVIGLLVAFCSTAGSKYGRRGLAVLAGCAAALLPVWGAIAEWVTRGQSAESISSLSGRTAVWDFIVHAELDAKTFLFGHGLGEKRVLLRRGEGDFQTVPIDNSWLDAYWETGLTGLFFVGAGMIGAVIFALRTTGAPARATSLFLLGYVAVASVNESGLCDFSSLTLLVVLAIMVGAVDRSIRRSPETRRTPPATSTLLLSDDRRGPFQKPSERIR